MRQRGTGLEDPAMIMSVKCVVYERSQIHQALDVLSHGQLG
jgi:hypothetical protein